MLKSTDKNLQFKYTIQIKSNQMTNSYNNK